MGKFLSIFLILILFAATLQVNAQTTSVKPSTNAQVQGFTNGATSGNSSNNAFGNAAADAVGCGAGQLVAGLARNGVSAVVGSVKGSATNAITSQLNVTRVPTQDADTPAIRDDNAKSTGKETGGGSPTLTGSVAGAFDLPSWDSVGYCLANAAIHYVTQSTVNWINSGFKGSPAFVDNPEQFFIGIADQEAGGFIEELGLGFLCTEFSPKVRIALVNDYMKSTNGVPYKNRASCTMTNAVNNVEKISADFQRGDLSSYVEYVGNPANRAASSYLMAHDELNRRVSVNQGRANFELRTTDFLSFKKCEDVTNKTTGKTEQRNCRTYGPGKVIEDELNNALGAKYDRLAIADEFDEVVTALINQLIKTALSEVLSDDSGSSNSSNDRFKTDSDSNSNSNTNSNTNNNSQPTTVVDGSTTGGTPTERVITATCTTDVVASTQVGKPVTFTARPRGGAVNQDYTYEWLDVPDARQHTTDNQLVTYFQSPTTATLMRVRVTSAGKRAIATCPTLTIAPADPIVASCKPSTTNAKKVTETVTWTAQATGGNGQYVYNWSGEGLDNKTGSSTTTIYDTKGDKTAFVQVISGAESIDVTCSETVKVK